MCFSAGIASVDLSTRRLVVSHLWFPAGTIYLVSLVTASKYEIVDSDFLAVFVKLYVTHSHIQCRYG